MPLCAAPITTSIFELLKAGPGPSSSHTIGPMRAGLDFRALLDALPEEDKARARKVEARLFGSLSATGRGHGTDRAVLAGLLGRRPESCSESRPENYTANYPEGDSDAPPDEFQALPGAGRRIRLGGNELPLGPENVIFDSVPHEHPHSNTLTLSLLDGAGGRIFSRTYYSVGGGFIQWEGWSAPERPKPPYPYNSWTALAALADESGLNVPQIIMANEMAISRRSRAEVRDELDAIIAVMRRSVDRGIRREGVLPGSLLVYRKAAQLARKADCMDDPLNRFLGLLNAYAFAVAEENASGGVIVTAPTCGSAGVVAAVLTIMEGYLGFGPEAVRDGLLAAVAVGFLAKHNAGIAGAEVGCQGEVGVASAMAAAMLAQARGYAPQIVANAAEIALEHHLGLTCDPVGGYVQIPCIERNAMGALKAYNACLVASMEDSGKHRVSLDMTIQAMSETGQDMHAKYKETSAGGLAASVIEC